MSEFKDKRYTTIVRVREIVNCITGEKDKKPNKYGVYDNKIEAEMYLPNFKPVCYEDVRIKANELNNSL